MQKMTDLEIPLRAGFQEFIRQLSGVVGVASLAAMDGPHPHGVKHCRDASGCQLSIVRDQGGQMWPVHLWARLDMAFDIVCMQFDKTGNNEITGTIQGTGWDMIPFSNITNDAVFDCHRTSEYLIFQHKLRIGET
jgi:hypothetical protein